MIWASSPPSSRPQPGFEGGRPRLRFRGQGRGDARTRVGWRGGGCKTHANVYICKCTYICTYAYINHIKYGYQQRNFATLKAITFPTIFLFFLFLSLKNHDERHKIPTTEQDQSIHLFLHRILIKENEINNNKGLV